jgi:hypothetical protein
LWKSEGVASYLQPLKEDLCWFGSILARNSPFSTFQKQISSFNAATIFFWNHMESISFDQKSCEFELLHTVLDDGEKSKAEMGEGAPTFFSLPEGTLILCTGPSSLNCPPCSPSFSFCFLLLLLPLPLLLGLSDLLTIFHNLTIRSLPAVANHCPSGEIAQHF